MNENNSILRQATTTKELADSQVVTKLSNGLRLELEESVEGKVTTYNSDSIHNNGLSSDRSYYCSYGSNDEIVQEEDKDLLLKEGEVVSDGRQRLFSRQQEIIATESTVSLMILWRKGKSDYR
jgi:predicted methyltransferase